MIFCRIFLERPRVACLFSYINSSVNYKGPSYTFFEFWVLELKAKVISVYLYLYLYIYSYTMIYISISIYLYLLSIYLSIHPSIHPSVQLLHRMSGSKMCFMFIFDYGVWLDCSPLNFGFIV